MSHVMTYNTLLTDVENYCDRHDDVFLAQIPRFIALAEFRINNEVQGLGYLRYVTSDLEDNVFVYDKPEDWRETASFIIGIGTANAERKSLFRRTYEYCRKFWPNPTLKGQPRYYSDYGFNRLLVVPTPDATYPFELGYHQMPTPLSPSSQSNWTTEYAPQLLLYATLLETAPFLKNDERIQVWEGLYEKAKAAVKIQDKRQQTDQSSQPEA